MIGTALIWLAKRIGHYLIYLLFTAALAWSVYVAAIRPHTKPNPTTKEQAETITHETYNCKGLFIFGCGGKKAK